MKKEVLLNLEKEIFKGNLLDIGFSNHGIIYNIYKEYVDDSSSVEYVEGKEEKKAIEEGIYDTCALFFTLSDINLTYNKRKLVQDIYKYLKVDGLLYIWDIDKGIAKTFTKEIKIVLPDKSTKQINLRDLNLFKNSSKDNTMRILEPYFKVLTLKNSDNVYYMICKKKVKRKD
ncbi:class I SAM-dependent methyltransferase [Clostridium estertheticum]|uniref:class I SAM-dependent methyltransferase n=1 Tax=Clostridium estertheticum TaxID=238834 RepID=UPI001CF5C39D|nr:class I SAM-dependent methyltransferase [Clostridium estertheticum]MCB2306518.1 class I SAM-dependent methyltransferase [Clostridium estertheticum]MCB2345106.1 class I SAM-dependent methyltransferase [Clostridium estertheticum]MCB2350120.1 class I SAM-dependent methyltransferase [Clostridium estertheticum]WAG44289.1 class I SAM-dependent methyltransferase [Clostridium estertheticum]